jgi:hypothetical protein
MFEKHFQNCFVNLLFSGTKIVFTFSVRSGTSHAEKIGVRQIYSHPEYQDQKSYNDIAVVELGDREQLLNFQSLFILYVHTHVHRVCLLLSTTTYAYIGSACIFFKNLYTYKYLSTVPKRLPT